MDTKSIKFAAAGVLAALVVATSMSPVSAEPKLPKGWIRGVEKLEKLPPRGEIPWGTMQGVHEGSFRVRPSVPGGRVDLAALPVVEVGPVSAPAELPAALPEGSPGDVIVLKKKGSGRRVSVQGFEAGVIQIGRSFPAAIGRQSEGGVAGACGDGAKGEGVRALSYEAIRRVDPNGAIELVWARGLLDAATCRAVIVDRRSARPVHVGGGVVYAFRTRCPSCAEASREVLHVLTPQMDDRFEKAVPFEHRTLALAPGKSGAFEGSSSFRSAFRMGSWGLPDWEGVIDRQCKKDTVWCSKDVRFEVSQGLGEASPVVFVGGDVGM